MARRCSPRHRCGWPERARPLDALLPAFLAAALAEQGDASQLLALAILARFGARPAPLVGVALAVAVNAAVAAGGGAVVHALLPHRPTLLLTALALLLAGGGALFAAVPPKVALYDRLGPAGASFVAMLVLGIGDKTQFLTFALAARSDAAALAGVGAAAGTLLGLAPVLIARAAWPGATVRKGVAALFLPIGAVVALVALRLI